MGKPFEKPQIMSRERDFSTTLIYNKGTDSEFHITVSGSYYPGTPDTYYDKGDDPELEITDIELTKGKFWDFICENITFEDIEERCLNEIE